ncbi:hypothetical protein CON21_30800 [Bacillus thuringiensis]|uniref:reverse transcriptase domain-containing protein n=1 Tax=Bacillus thuringiensis TaxID=1428 RepID=UPI000BED1468|nr:reverse transcriptase domain-containing protein [Bacillus thuringiensis]PEE96966.1 hypothetical protein CON21_30800 [Bacillus thuringiensis]
MAVYKDFNKYFKFENLESLYIEKISHKPSMGIDGINKKSFESNLNTYISIVNRKVFNSSYNFTPYKEKLISKGKNKHPRIISVPTLRDKLTLATIHKILSNAYSLNIKQELVQTTIAKIKKAIELDKYDYFIKLDIETFYDRIDHEILLKKLKRKVRKKELLNLIMKALKTPTINVNTQKPYIDNEKGVPQGLSISNILANVYMNDLDKELNTNNKFAYFRYVDDILILCKEEDKAYIEKKIEKKIKQLGLDVHPDKNISGCLLTEEFTFLGYKIQNQSLRVLERNVHKLEKSIAEVFTCYKYSDFKRTNEFVWSLNIKITGGIIQQNKYGWLFFYSQINNLKVLYKLDWYITQLWKKFGINKVERKYIKSFVKSFNEISFNRSKTKYIPNFDKYTIQQKKILLTDIFEIKNVDHFSEERIDRYFKKYVFNTIKKLDKDIQHIS